MAAQTKVPKNYNILVNFNLPDGTLVGVTYVTIS